MHEASLARQILAVVLERAREGNASRVRAVHGWIAETERLSVASLTLHFTVAAAGTVAAGARLELEVVHVAARCRECAHVFRPEHHVLTCPECAAVDAEPLGRVGLGIDAIDVEER